MERDGERIAMTRSELIQIISAKQSQLSDKEVALSIKYVFDKMIEALAEGQRIEIRGFGSFAIRFRPARPARNPKTGERVQKEGKYSLHFKPGKEMRDRVNSFPQQPLLQVVKNME